jgi:NDP-sugar pyrophosphorylase family protein
LTLHETCKLDGVGRCDKSQPYQERRRAKRRPSGDLSVSASKRTAVVLAGGLGSRLRPYTVVLPKPLMPIGEMPILEVIIKQLSRAGVQRVILAVNYQADILRAYFGDGERLGVNIEYSLESKPLGTMGPLKLMNELPDNFLIMNGDVLCDLDFGAFFDRHEREERLFTIAASEREQLIDYGVLGCANNRLVAFTEKPRSSYLVSMGVYCASKRILDWIPSDAPYGFDQLMLALIGAQHEVHVDPHAGYWLDIGRPDDYFRAIDEWPQIKAGLAL